MTINKFPKLTDHEINDFFNSAEVSPRHRQAMLLHKKGDEFNHVYNFMLFNSYMQPHLHPGQEKIECIYLIHGKIKIIFFDDTGKIKNIVLLEKEKEDFVNVPAYTWHTYVIMTNQAITYETMSGIYDPNTWKNFAAWAPPEGNEEALMYLEALRKS